MKGIQARFKNKVFLLAFAGFIYQMTVMIGWEIPFTHFKMSVDIISYLFIGFGVYTSFEAKGKDEVVK